jgi:hypothetical protein
VSEIQEVETVDLFMDKTMFDYSKEIINELKNDFPEFARECKCKEMKQPRKWVLEKRP